MQIKVLHIASGLNGGIASFIKNKAKALVNTNVVFDILAFNEAPKDFAKLIAAMGGKIYYMPNPKEKGFIKFYKRVNQVMSKENKYDLIHCHLRDYRALPFYLIAKKNKQERFAIHAHSAIKVPENKKTFLNIMRKLNTSMADDMLSCSTKASYTCFSDEAVQAKKIMHIPNSIDPEKYLKAVDKESLKLQILGEENLNKKIIGHVGRVQYPKNHEFMLDVVAELSKKYRNFLWLFIGDGRDLDSLKAEVNERKLNDYVCFMGRRNDVHNLYKIMDFFVLPSLFEGLPTVAIEAQAAGTNCLLADTITKECDLNLNLVKYLPLDVKTWAENILNTETIKVDKEQRLARLVEKKFTNQESAKLYLDFLNKQIKYYSI